MNRLLEIRTSLPPDRGPEPLLSVSAPSAISNSPPPPAAGLDSPSSTPADLSTHDRVLDTLRSRPSAETISRILPLLIDPLAIHSPSPHASQIVRTLLETTLPDFSTTLSKRDSRLLTRCMRSITGIGGIAARLRELIPLVKDREGATADANRRNAVDLLVLLQAVLGAKRLVIEIWKSVGGEQIVKRGVLWKEFVALIAGGKVLAVAAEAESSLGSFAVQDEKRWIGHGKLYSSWLGGSIAEATMELELVDDSGWKDLAVLLAKGLGLGYSDELIENSIYPLLRDTEGAAWLQKLASFLAIHEKRSYLTSLLRVISAKHLQKAYPETDENWSSYDAKDVASTAALLRLFISDDGFRDMAVEWLTSTSGGGVGEPIALRRALLTALKVDQTVLQELFEKSLQQFSDKLWIKHTPIVRQEVNAQILLLCAGHCHRHSPAFLKRLGRSSTFLNGVSNRLGASSQKARFLGMVVGEVFSTLIDPATKMSFDVEETSSEEAAWWKSIPQVDDQIGSLEDLFRTETAVISKKSISKGGGKQRQTTPASSAVVKIQSIEEIIDDSTDEDEDEFTPYAKPDSDAEDSDDDPTTINRNKDGPPVYIRDLLTYLRATDSYDRQHLALTTATSLIRRKAGFGTELTSHLFTLAALLTSLDDRYDMPDFDTLRLGALVSLVVAEPTKMGQWLAREFFSGDYGISQRAVLLTAMGIGARELAGLQQPPPETTSFPSKRLPSKAEAAWSSSGPKDRKKELLQTTNLHTQIDTISTSLQRDMITPMAATAADQVTGPNVLKVRTFSSRMAVEKRRPKPAHRKILAVVAEGFFFPLTGAWWVHVRDFGSGHMHPHLLSTFIKTLAIILHAAGPAAPALPQMTAELWDFLFAVRKTAGEDVAVLEGLLFALLTLLDINVEAGEVGRRRLAEDHGTQLMETQGWVDNVFEMGGGEKNIRMLAASVLVKIGAIVEEYRRTLMGSILSLED